MKLRIARRLAHKPMICLPLAFLVGMQGASAGAPDDEELALVYGAAQTISLATGASQPMRRAPAVATVVTAADIAAMGLTDLDEVIETVAGVHVSRGPISYSSLYIVRGIGGGDTRGPQVLVLQNGVPVGELYTGDKSQTWASMPLQHVARIEILRGPGSALYGADAFAGVINIITKSPADLNNETTMGVQAGSFRSGDAWLLHGSTHGELGLAAFLQFGRTDGPRNVIEADAQSLNDHRFGTHASLAPGPVARGQRAADAHLELTWKNWRWRLDGKLRDQIGLGAGTNNALDPDHSVMQKRYLSDLSWNAANLGQGWGAGAQLSWEYLHTGTGDGLMLFPPGARIGASYFPNGMIGGPGRWEQTVRASAWATYAGWRGHALRVGLGHDDLDLFRVTTFKNFLLNPAGVPIPSGPVSDYGQIQNHTNPRDRRDTYAYAQDEWQFARDWALTAGVRHDAYSDFGSTTNPRLALVWDANVDLTAKLLHARAFRAPAFNESYGINPVTNGNPALQPETIATTEAVLGWQATRALHANLSLFDYDRQNIIQVVPNPAPAPGGTFNNVGRVKGHGAELELGWDGGRSLRGALNLAWQSGTDQRSGKDPGYAPHRHLFARAEWQVASGYQLVPQLNWVADRRRADGDARAPIADYTTLDLAVRAKRGPWEWSASVRNLFNADAREPSAAPGLALPYDLPLAGRSFGVQLSVRM
ncbi:MAG: TonB-dependent receptor [Pseudomonadota bacterium]